MNLGYSNDRINSTIGSMTTEHLVNFCCCSYGLGIMLEKVGGILKRVVWQEVYFFHGKLFSS